MQLFKSSRKLEAVTAEGRALSPGAWIADRHGRFYTFLAAARRGKRGDPGTVKVIGPFGSAADDEELSAYLFGLTVRDGGGS
jgi:hypothetical protein